MPANHEEIAMMQKREGLYCLSEVEKCKARDKKEMWPVSDKIILTSDSSKANAGVDMNRDVEEAARPFRKRILCSLAMLCADSYFPFASSHCLTVDATIGNQAFSHDRPTVYVTYSLDYVTMRQIRRF